MPCYAEVIGDPVAHSRSPTIHRFWLATLGLAGDCRATRVRPDELEGYLATRRRDPLWLGCSVTAPLKSAVLPFLDDWQGDARQIGAINCVSRRGDRLAGLNSDVDGVAEALREAAIAGEKVAMIGGGGAARAAISYLMASRAERIAILVRSPDKAALLADMRGAETEVEVMRLDDCEDAVADAATIINASPLGMAGAAPMPEALLAALARARPGAAAFDMVYQPPDTAFLAAARGAGLNPVDGLAMLIGQARRPFQLFFGAVPPAGKDGELRQMLAADDFAV